MSKRRKRSRRATAMYLAFVLGVAMLLSALIIVSANEILAFSRPDYEAVVEIPENATPSQVSHILRDAGIIDHPLLFEMFVGLKKEVKFVAGKFLPNSNLDYRALLRMLTNKSNYRETVSIMIPEGYEISQIVDALTEKRVCNREELEEVIKNHDFEDELIDTLPTGKLSRLEGFLFPDTYEFYVDDDPVRVIGKFLTNFNKKFTGSMRDRCEEIGYSQYEILILASIIEREATSADREIISSVFHNRLESKKYPYLESCATVQYALGERKTRLTIADTKIESDYNTYHHKGLPPTPISSPGTDSIEAALYPDTTDYLFFALQEDGTHKFSKTYEEHLKVPNVNPAAER